VRAESRPTRIAVAIVALLAVSVAGCSGEAVQSATPSGSSVSTAGCTPVELRGPDGRQIDLSGTWSGNDGGRYYIKQIDSCVWWSALSNFPSQSLGDEWIMAFRGTLGADGRIVGDFVDVKGTNPGSGTMTIRVQAEERSGQVVVELYREQVTGHQIGVTFWERTTPDPLPTPAGGGTLLPGSTSDGATSTPDGSTPASPGETSPAVTLPPG
jgi:hypothetical protein